MAFGIAVGAGGFIGGGGASINISLILTYGAIALTSTGISPLIITINTRGALEVSWSKAFHTPVVTHLTDICIVAIVDITLLKTRPFL